MNLSNIEYITDNIIDNIISTPTSPYIKYFDVNIHCLISYTVIDCKYIQCRDCIFNCDFCSLMIKINNELK